MQTTQRDGYGSAAPISLWERLSLASGVAFVVLVMAAIFIAPGHPDHTASVAEFAAAYVSDRGGHLLSTYFSGLSAVAFLVFLSALCRTLWRESDGGALAQTVFSSGLVSVTLILVAQAIYAGTTLLAGTEGVAPGVVLALDQMVPIVTLFSDFPRALFIASAAIGILQTAAVPRWLGWLGVVVALVNTVGTAAYFDLEGLVGLLSFVGLLLFAVWTLMVSVALLLSNMRQPAPQALTA